MNYQNSFDDFRNQKDHKQRSNCTRSPKSFLLDPFCKYTYRGMAGCRVVPDDKLKPKHWLSFRLL